MLDNLSCAFLAVLCPRIVTCTLVYVHSQRTILHTHTVHRPFYENGREKNCTQ